MLEEVVVYDTHAILLRPRPFAKASGRLILLPLLPRKAVTKPLPSEIWAKILGYVFADYQRPSSSGKAVGSKLNLLLVCKSLKDVALPLYYEDIHLDDPAHLEQFTELLRVADRRWDSIRRIPYSAPGRWVHSLDLSDLRCNLWSEVCLVDTLLTRLVPLLPFLAHLVLNSTIAVSRRLVDSICSRDGIGRLLSLKGIKLASSVDLTSEDTFLEVLRCSQNLEELEIYGSGVEPLLTDIPGASVDFDFSAKPLRLPRLRKLAAISMHCSPVMFFLLHSSLPMLTHLTITPYDDVSVPSSLVPRFIERHGAELASLHLYAPKAWPTMLFPSPTTLLYTCPKLNHLSLENPLPTLTICSIYPKHPLKILSIPRPEAGFLRVLESLLPKLPALKVVRARDVRWLRAGMSSHAHVAGVQGEMRDWRQRLARRGVTVVDTAWMPQGG
ncbi:uncharacterized protein PHACADRAFT_247953 [Phanerochaete carnosa HHB-10118-sp]|uniref:F-box domain-containing protein n=1 Tax=Phanerochaete carnosa (strain HHB-10118-sp) TaxID=650164 RepID=K5WPL4_PHACS|nr:uncharacterized protein PHACADRAFT_247953 [Phanerochaete carnosa HHB-10118-sp]EKM61390.1 hypothetical protein PHACADRAFT_247953 [Phanerochaete carnosa HHB-10118-sp]